MLDILSVPYILRMRVLGLSGVSPVRNIEGDTLLCGAPPLWTRGYGRWRRVVRPPRNSEEGV